MPDDPRGKSHDDDDLEGLSEEELEERLQKLLGEAPNLRSHDPRPQPEEERTDIESRLQKISDNLDKAKARSFPEPPEVDLKGRTVRKDPANYKGLGIGISIAYVLVGSMALGWVVGWLVDRRTGGTAGQAFGALAGCVVGIGMTFWLMSKNTD
jgi:hypothetical protein